ncbi:MAG: cytochrome c biogenesis protein ResB [Deltaproteobacteria bacterium]|nr:cytochrome c biogenesis protein ResB [Deltaproteobacteria bacterium]
MSRTENSRPVSLRATFQAVAAIAGAGFLVQHAVERIWAPAQASRPLASMLAGIATCVLLLALGSTRRRLLFLSSRHLAVATLAALTAYGIIGTLLLQAVPAHEYEATYGGAARFIFYLLLDDVFHSMPFAFVTGTAAAGLVLSFLRSRSVDARRLGVLAAHAGCLLVLAGAALQSFGGVKGRLEMHEGETARSFLVSSAGGMTPTDLGFTLRLDDFQLLSYEPEIRLRVFSVDEAGQELVASVDPAEALGAPGSLARFDVRVTDYWPDHEPRLHVEPARDREEGVPAVGLGIEEGQSAWMLDTGRLEDARIRVGAGALVTFFWREADARAYLGEGEGPPSPHVVVTDSGPLRVEVGSSHVLNEKGERFRVKAFYNDIVLDVQIGTARNRSDQPVNPALRVELLGPAGEVREASWLFAKYPSFHSSDPESPLAGLRYSHEPASGDLESWVITGERGEILRVGGGEPQPLPERGATIRLGGVDVKVLDLIESASVTTENRTRSDSPFRPVVRILQGGAGGRPLFLQEGHAADLGGGMHIVLARRQDSDQDYLSTVSVIEDGRTVRTQTIEVNHPLRHRGFAIYQSDFNPRDETFSGFQVVRDPGLPLVYAGFVLCTVGVLVAFYLGPFLGRRRREARCSR